MLYQTTAAVRRGFESCEIIGEAVSQTAKLGIKGVSKATRAIKKWNNYCPARYKLLDCPKPEAVLAQWNLIQHPRRAGGRRLCQRGHKQRSPHSPPIPCVWN